jgi:hypothetical protein
VASPELEREIDRLYALPLADFIGERNELAKRLKAAGDSQTADEVKALAKSSVTAWAVNALYHHQREAFDALIEAAAAVRAALAGKGDRREAEAARRQALRALLGRAAKILARAGHAATPANRQRVSHTLETLAARDPAMEGPRPGRLVADLEPQGFDILAGLAASLAPARPTAARAARSAARKGAKASPEKGATAAAKVADERREAARRKLGELETALVELEREADAAETAAAEAKTRQEQLIEGAAEAARIATAAEKAAKAAKKELAAATAAATRAKAARRKGLTRIAAAKRRLARHEEASAARSAPG